MGKRLKIMILNYKKIKREYLNKRGYNNSDIDIDDENFSDDNLEW